MNTMQGFYTVISSSSEELQNSYLKKLADLTKINREQAHALMSDMGWQEWVEQNQKVVNALSQ